MRRVQRIAAIVVTATLPLAACERPSAKAPALVAQRNCLPAQPVPVAAPATTGMVLMKGGRFLQGAAPARREEGPPRATQVGFRTVLRVKG